jgi:hypothetical protein
VKHKSPSILKAIKQLNTVDHAYHANNLERENEQEIGKGSPILHGVIS